jgi:hypothetical protein
VVANHLEIIPLLNILKKYISDFIKKQEVSQVLAIFKTKEKRALKKARKNREKEKKAVFSKRMESLTTFFRNKFKTDEEFNVNYKRSDQTDPFFKTRNMTDFELVTGIAPDSDVVPMIN